MEMEMYADEEIGGEWRKVWGTRKVEVVMWVRGPRGQMFLFNGGWEEEQCEALREFMKFNRLELEG